jgi:ribonuclease E
VVADGTDAGAPAGDAAPREGGEGRRRGRGGRDRNRRERGEDGNVEGAPQGMAASDATDAPIQAVTVAEPAPMEVAAYAPAAAADTASVAAEAPAPEQRVEPDMRFATITPAAHEEPVAAPVAVAAAPAPVEVFVLPLDRLQAVAESAGLQWVNSDADKIRAVQAAMAAEPPPAHVPRERKPLERVDEGPLVLVETRKDLTQFKLPFETAQGSQPQA